MTRIYDVVRLVGDRPGDGLVAGALGTVVEVFETPSRAYEVEFVDAGGATVALLTLTAGEVEPVHT
jgi:hypothetical protein